MKQIKNMTEQERIDTLVELAISTPKILDYLIETHQKALQNNNNVSKDLSAFWLDILNDLRGIRSKFR